MPWMDDVSTLITAIAALVTATGGALSAVIVAWRSTARQRYRAAEEAGRLTVGRPSGRHALRDDEVDEWGDDGDAADEP